MVFLIPWNYAQISSRRAHAATQMPTFKQRLWVIVWTSGILSLITCSQHSAAHNKQVGKFPFSFSLFLLCPLTVIPLPLSFSLGLRMRAEEEGCGVNKGWGEGVCVCGVGGGGGLSPANNPFFQQVQLHIPKLKMNARKKGFKKH